MLRYELRGRGQLSHRGVRDLKSEKSNASPVWCVWEGEAKHAGSLSSPENLRIWQMWVRQKKREEKATETEEETHHCGLWGRVDDLQLNRI